LIFNMTPFATGAPAQRAATIRQVLVATNDRISKLYQADPGRVLPSVAKAAPVKAAPAWTTTDIEAYLTPLELAAFKVVRAALQQSSTAKLEAALVALT
jgi:hypothetical protein